MLGAREVGVALCNATMLKHLVEFGAKRAAADDG
jgi:hypothetical protein